MAPEPPPGALRLDIDRDALTSNWRTLDALSGRARAGAAVKADGYGLGVSVVAPVLREAGCRDFFVAHWSEVAPLIRHVPAGEIAVLHGPLHRADADYARTVGVKPVINSIAQARTWLEAGGGLCDLMVDTGINRLGLSLAEIGDEAIGCLDIDVLHSHLASAEEDVPLNALQLARWNDAKGQIRHARCSLANSAGIALGTAYHGDLTRPGLSLYGGIQRRELEGHIRQVVRPQAAILQVRQVAAGEGLGYNGTYVATTAMRIGTIALGYADGYLRCWSGKGTMRSHGRTLSVVGRVSMDMTLIDLTETSDLCEGDWVEVDYSPVEAAARSGLSQYELFTLLGSRFGR